MSAVLANGIDTEGITTLDFMGHAAAVYSGGTRCYSNAVGGTAYTYWGMVGGRALSRYKRMSGFTDGFWV